jgi:hypothetical protein
MNPCVVWPVLLEHVFRLLHFLLEAYQEASFLSPYV